MSQRADRGEPRDDLAAGETSQGKASQGKTPSQGTAGSQEALAEQALALRPQLLSVARRVLRHRDDAEGVVDECLARLLDPEVSRKVDRPGAWLHRSVLHLAIDRARAWVRHQEKIERVSRDRAESSVPVDEVERVERREAVWRHLLELPPRQQEVLILREMEGLSYPEIALRLAIDDSTARVHAHAGRRELRWKLAEWSEAED